MQHATPHPVDHDKVARALDAALGLPDPLQEFAEEATNRVLENCVRDSTASGLTMSRLICMAVGLTWKSTQSFFSSRESVTAVHQPADEPRLGELQDGKLQHVAKKERCAPDR